QEGMLGTTQPDGTAYYAMLGSPYPIAGKTGTAQKVSRRGSVSVAPHQLPLALRHQAWFIGYAPAANPTIAVAAAAGHGAFGCHTAAPLARKTMDAWMLGKVPGPVQGGEGRRGGEPGPVDSFDDGEGAGNGIEAFRGVEDASEATPAEATA